MRAMADEHELLEGEHEEDEAMVGRAGGRRRR